MKAYFQEMANSLRNNKLRTFLTGFSIAWGIIILVVMLGAGKGVENGIRSMVAQAGADQMVMDMQLGTTQLPYAGYKEGRQVELTQNQLEYLKGQFSDRIKTIEPVNYKFLEVSTVFGSTTLERRTFSALEQEYDKLEMRGGRMFSASEHEEGARVMLISDSSISTLFGANHDPIGEFVTVAGMNFKIIGIIKSPVPFYGVAYIPYNTFEALYPNETFKIWRFRIYPEPAPTNQIQTLKSDLIDATLSVVKADPNDQWAVGVRSTSDTAQAMAVTFTSLQLLLWIMGIGSLSVGTIGVSNIMHVTIQERMREIGIRKAIGAKPKDIMGLVLGESLLLSVTAGLVGLVIGIGVIMLMDYLAEVNKWGQQVIPVGYSETMTMTLFENPQVNLGIAFGALIVLVIAGLIAGYGPAKKAIKIPAIVAMRDLK